MGLETSFSEAEVALKSMNLGLDIVKMEYSSKKKKAKEHKGEKLTPSSKVMSCCLSYYVCQSCRSDIVTIELQLML